MRPNIRVDSSGKEWSLIYDVESRTLFPYFPAGPFDSQHEAVKVALRCAGMIRASVTMEN